jgi:hypothetical protein
MGEWKLVPVEPTAAQLRAGQFAWLEDPQRRSSTLYRAMVGAASPAPAGEPYGYVNSPNRLEMDGFIYPSVSNDGGAETPLYLAPPSPSDARAAALEEAGAILSERIAEASRHQAAAYARRSRESDRCGEAWRRAQVALQEAQAAIRALGGKDNE